MTVKLFLFVNMLYGYKLVVGNGKTLILAVSKQKKKN